MSTATTTRTILRIKRRRTETAVPCIRLEGLASRNYQENYANGIEKHPVNNISKRNEVSSVLWKRSGGNNEGVDSCDAINSSKCSEVLGGNYRVVDAILLSDGDDEENMRSGKRRKLTLLDSSIIPKDVPSGGNRFQKAQAGSGKNANSNSKKGRLKVLDPLSRVVDDSLHAVLRGEKTVESHYRYLTTDPTFTLREINLQMKWLTWSLCDTGTNILHCCALWNDPTVANEVLQRFANMSDFKNGGIDEVGKNYYKKKGINDRIQLMESIDSDGRTPYEVAQLIGHERVCEVLEIYGGDTSNYVYDVFYPEDSVMQDTFSSGHDGKKDPSRDEHYRSNEKEELSGDIEGTGIMVAELTGGVAYWNHEGELILDSDSYEKGLDNFREWQEDEVDSNCEDYEANDYPEEYDNEEEDSYFNFELRELKQHSAFHPYDSDSDFLPCDNGDSAYDDSYNGCDWE